MNESCLLNPDEHISALAKAWYSDPDRPKAQDDALQSWSTAVREYVEDDRFPLILRRPGSFKGQVLTHSTGRALTFADNSPAMWIFENICAGRRTTANQLMDSLMSGALPVAKVLTRADRARATYTGTLPANPIPGLVLCHLDDISEGQHRWTKICDLPIDKLKERSVRFLLPENMFVVRRGRHYTQGLGENALFREALRRLARDERLATKGSHDIRTLEEEERKPGGITTIAAVVGFIFLLGLAGPLVRLTKSAIKHFFP